MSERAPGSAGPAARGVPEPFLSRLEAWLPVEDAADLEGALAAASRALVAALRPSGRERAGAFDLLAADALVTRACGAAVLEPDPEAALEGILERVTQARP